MKLAGVLLKVAATVALLWFVFSKVDLAELAHRVRAQDIALALAAGIAVLSLQAWLIALRMRLCARMLGHELAVWPSWVASQYGGFFSHTPISFIGGDAMRVWHLVGTGLPLGAAAKAVFMDRALGFMGMMALALASAPALASVITDERMLAGLVFMLALGTAACVVFLLLGALKPLAHPARLLRWTTEFATVSRHLREHPRTAFEAAALAFALTALNVVAIWAIAAAYGFGVPFGTVFTAAPIVFLIAMIPISVAGWGLREGAFVVVFGLLGVAPEVALTASVTLGVAVLLAYTPAPVLFITRRLKSS